MAASNSQKTPFAKSFNEAASRRVANAIQLLGKALPAEVVKVDPTVGGAIVTVKFPITSPFTLPQVRMPAAMSEYTRLPLQAATEDTPGTKGVCFPADTFIGLTSGLAAGAAPTLVQPGNLAALVFFPIGNLNWTAPDDLNALVLYGEPDVIIKDKTGQSFVTVTPTSITLTRGSCVIKLTGTEIDINAGNSINVNINGRNFLAHTHSGVQTGSGHTGGVV